MKALRFETFGPPSVLSIQDLPRPALEAGEVLVQIKASSINPSDVGTVAGRFHSKLPMTPGRDYAGVVVEGGEWKGKHVWGTGAGFGVVRPGAHAEFVAVPSSWLSGKPAGLSMEQAAVVGVPCITAWLSLVEAGGLQNGERLLITGGSGAVGSAATQIAHWKGATVLAADRIEGAQDADVFLNLKETDLVSGVQRATDGKGVDIVLDTVGGNQLMPPFVASWRKADCNCQYGWRRRRSSFQFDRLLSQPTSPHWTRYTEAHRAGDRCRDESFAGGLSGRPSACFATRNQSV